MSGEEQWRPIPGVDGYDVSDHGRVRSWWPWRQPGWRTGAKLAEPRILAPGLGGNGYLTVVVAGRSQYVHHLVLRAFVGPRPRGQVTMHANDLKTDNRLCNLSWDSQARNVRDGWAIRYLADARRTIADRRAALERRA